MSVGARRPGGRVAVDARPRRRRGSRLRDLGDHLLKDFPERQRLWQARPRRLPAAADVENRQTQPAADGLAAARPGARGRRARRAAVERGAGGDDHRAGRHGQDPARDRRRGRAGRPRRRTASSGCRSPGCARRTSSCPRSRRRSRRPQDLAEHLRERQALLALDNFEHVLDARRPVSELLAQAPRREAADDEPRGAAHHGRARLRARAARAASATTLFVERARAAGRELEADATVAAICRRLDCLPLAIELAAARARLLEPAAMLGRLERSLAVLTRGSADAPERQQTLRATIEWSHDLLNEEARVLLRRLSVFAGGFSLDAAEEVAGADLDALEELVDLSLLKARDDGRFLMLETIREFAAERREAGGEEAELKAAHVAFVVRLAEAAEPHLRGSGQERWLRAIDDDYDNVRAALGRARDAGDRELGRRGSAPRSVATGAPGRWSRRGGRGSRRASPTRTSSSRRRRRGSSAPAATSPRSRATTRSSARSPRTRSAAGRRSATSRPSRARSATWRSRPCSGRPRPGGRVLRAQPRGRAGRRGRAGARARLAQPRRSRDHPRRVRARPRAGGGGGGARRGGSASRTSPPCRLLNLALACYFEATTGRVRRRDAARRARSRGCSGGDIACQVLEAYAAALGARWRRRGRARRCWARPTRCARWSARPSSRSTRR